jgi:tetratricopeptide (TPR) repeat protein
LYAYLIVCVPVLNLTEPVLIPQDRYSYLADLVFLLGVYDTLVTTLQAGQRRWALAVGAALAFYGMALSWAQLSIWEDSYTLFAYLEAEPCVEEHTTLRYQMMRMKAGQLTLDGRYEEAIANYLEFARHRGVDTQLLHQIGLDYYLLGQYAKAQPFLEDAYKLGLKPETAQLLAAVKAKLADGKAAASGEQGAAGKNVEKSK